MDIGQLVGKAILDVSDWISGADQAMSAIADLSAAAMAVGAATAAGIGAMAGIGIEVASNADRATTALGVMMKDTEAAGALMQDIRAMAAATPFESADLVAGAQSLMSMGFAAEEVIPTLTALGDAAAAAPAGMQAALPLIVRAFGQIRAKGKVSMEELYQLGENGVGAIGMIAESLGVTTAEAMKRVESGGLDAATGLNALMQGIERDLGGMMAKQSQTLDGVLSTLSDTFKATLGDMARPLVDALIAAIPQISAMGGVMLSALQPFFDGMAVAVRVVGALAAGFNDLSPEVQSFGAIAVGATASAAMGIGTIGAAAALVIPVVVTLAGAIAALDAALAPVLIAVGAVGVAFTAASAVAVAAISAIAAEWYILYSAWESDTGGMRSAMLAVWAVVQAGYAVISGLAGAILDAGRAWVGATGRMEGEATGLLGTVREVAAGIYTSLSGGVGRAAASVGDMLGKIRDAFVDMALTALTAVQRLLLAMSAIPGMSADLAVAQGKITEAVALIAGMRGGGFKFEFAAPDLSGLSSWWQGVTTTGTEQAAASYANALAGLTPGAAEQKGDGKESPKKKAEEEVDIGKLAEMFAAQYDARDNPAADFLRDFYADVQRASDATDIAGVQADLAIAMTAHSLTMDQVVAAEAAVAQRTRQILAALPESSEAEKAGALLKFGTPTDLGSQIRGWIRKVMAGLDPVADDFKDLGAATGRIADAIGQVAGGVGNIMLDALGGLGEAIRAGIEGAKQGGAAGAVVAVVGSMMSQTESFKNLAANLTDQFTVMVSALDPLVKGIGMVLTPVMDMAGAILTGLKPAFEQAARILGMLSPALMALSAGLQGIGVILDVAFKVLEPVMPIVEAAFMGLFRVMQGVSLVVLSVAWLIGSAWNLVLDGVIRLLAWINDKVGGMDDAIAKIRDMKADTGGMEEAMRALTDMTYASAYATAEASASTAMLAESAADAAESLTNVPSGYKVALARFEATQAQTMGGAAAGMSAGGGAGGIVVENLYISAQDPEELAVKLEQLAKTKAYRYTGTSLIGQAPRYSGSGSGP